MFLETIESDQENYCSMEKMSLLLTRKLLKLHFWMAHYTFQMKQMLWACLVQTPTLGFSSFSNSSGFFIEKNKNIRLNINFNICCSRKETERWSLLCGSCRYRKREAHKKNKALMEQSLFNKVFLSTDEDFRCCRDFVWRTRNEIRNENK